MNAKIVIFCLSIVSSFSSADWKNPTDKYLNAHKKYNSAACPITNSKIKHFVYFARNREAMHNHDFLTHQAFSGAQVMYQWAELEKKRGVYDFSKILSDIAYLEKYNKTYLFSYKMSPFISVFRLYQII